MVMLGHLSTLLLSLQLMSLAQSLTRTRPSLGDFLPLLILLIPGFLLSTLLTSLACFLLLDLSVIEAVCFGVCLAPLDPVYVAGTLRGRFVQAHLPSRLTWLLGAEAMVEHAIALPTLALPTLLLLHPGKEGWAVGRWALEAIAYDTLGSLIIGMIIGWGMGRLLPFLRAHDLLEPTMTSTDTLTSLLACILCGGSEIVGLNGLVVVCAAGVGIGLGDKEPPVRLVFEMTSETSKEPSRATHQVSERLWHVELLHWIFQCILGASIPFHEYASIKVLHPSHLIPLAMLLLIFRRIPAAFLCRLLPARFVDGEKVMRTPQCSKEALWVSWYGPVGCLSLHLTLQLLSNVMTTSNYKGLDALWATVTFISFFSSILQGSSLPSLLLFRERYCPLRKKKAERRKSHLWTLETGQQEGMWENGGRGPWRRWSQVNGRGPIEIPRKQQKPLVPIVRVDTTSLSSASSYSSCPSTSKSTGSLSGRPS
ncbi:MAG: Sodium/hydrogen exchanger family-domain-containing protein [Piptocephalis tieghemiana]|nr:MAG: Sodium/hydrogen exchanger family-domain-containing protein [Piptocephalis tieghemiana]